MQEKSSGFKVANIKNMFPRFLGRIIVVAWVLFTVIVIGWIFVASLSTTKEIFTNKLLHSGLQFKNYIKTFQLYNVGRYFLNSAIYTVTACLGVIFVAAPASYIMAKYVFKGKNIVRLAYASAMGIPGAMIMVPMFMLVGKLHMTESILTLILIYIFTSVPFTIFYLTGFFTTIPNEIQQAALIDGCSHIKAFWKVIFPLAQPGIVTVTMFNFIGIWNEYLWALIFASKAEKRTLAIGLQSIVQSMSVTGDYASLFAGVIIVFLPTFILFIILSNKIMTGITGGSVKG